LIDSSKLLDIPLLDHIIIGCDHWWNWKDEKLKHSSFS